VTYKKNNQEHRQIFDHVIIAIGNFGKPNWIGFEKFRDKDINIIHSSQFRKPDEYRNKDVLTIGGSHSASQISSEICRSAKSVTNLFKKPYWILPYYLYSNKYKKLLPYDFIIFGSRGELLNVFNELAKLPEKEQNKFKNNYFSRFTTRNSKKSDLNIDINSEESPMIAISENYMRCVDEGLITPEFRNLTNLTT
jgi:cation diffusion facilitator CzcD-associated flavoprotein CzcO